jgi:hypothetical protein
MAFASLLDAGADLDEVLAGLAELPARGWLVDVTKTERCGLVATQLQVHVPAGEDEVERTWATVRGMLDEARGLPERARQRAQKAFARLAAAEGRVHGLPPEEVHFHEVGGLDAIVDVVGTCLALESLGIDSVRCSPVALGAGTVRAAHGLLPNPAPAVLELLAGVPVTGSDQDAELTTPTGAALATALSESFGPLPAMKLTTAGYGAGSRNLEGLPNVLQVVVGELATAPETGSGRGTTTLDELQFEGLHQQLVVLEANVDDVTGELLAHTLASLVEAGALDAWIVPLIGKKGRPAHLVTALADPALGVKLARILASETGTLGLREHLVDRWAFPRRVFEVEVDGQPVRVKTGPYRFKAEHDDCVRAASHLGRPVSEVARRAEHMASLLQGPVA